jgi:nucleoside-diphosphate-sugar epimerase
MKLVVAGGNGFIGSQICRIAVENGHDVVGFGRSGRPNRTPVKHPWVGRVDWRRADIFDADAWTDALDGADAFIHSVAVITQDPERDVTFDRINGESAIFAAEQCVEAGVDGFAFLSVRDKPPFVSGRFLAAKRRAEREIPAQFPHLRFVPLRANLVYGPGRPGSSTLSALLRQLEGRVGSYSDRDGRPLPVELVAAAAVHAATTPTVRGTLSVNQIADLGRTSGLVDLDDVSDPSLLPLLLAAAGLGLGGWALRRLWR